MSRLPEPMSVIVPLVVVESVPPVMAIPWQAPLVPMDVAVIWIAAAVVDDVEKVPEEANPTPAVPLPSMELVAMIFPAVLKAPVTSIPSPPVAPPIQEENVQAPVVNDAQVPLMATPCEFTAPLPPVPLTLIGPVALETVEPILTPSLAVELGPPVPISVIVPLVVVLSVPPVSEIPWQAPVVPVELAVIAIADAEVEDVEKLADEKKPIPPGPCPWIVSVAVITPVVLNAASTSMPFPPRVLPP